MVAVVVVAGAGMLTVVGLVLLETSGCCCGGCRGGDADCCWFGIARDKWLLLWLQGRGC